MVDVSRPTVAVPRFDEKAYLAANGDVRSLLDAGQIDTGFQHFLSHGIDDGRAPLLKREALALQGGIERFFVSDGGYFLILGWLADEGGDRPIFKIFGGDFSVELPVDSVLRHARADIEAHVREGAYDYGFVAFGRTPSRALLKQAVLFQVNASSGAFQGKATPEIVADKRLLDTMLVVTAGIQSHAGKEANLHAFLAGAAGETAVELFRSHVARGIAGHHVERFRPRPVSRSFITVLFGSTEPVLLQPVLFRQSGIDFGEWIYVCNSPEDASAVLRLARTVSDLYDVMITVIVMTDNVGFGAANNVAVGHAASDRIFVVNPDVYPLAPHLGALRATLDGADFGDRLCGGLLFYDDHNLMHSGMFVENDLFFRSSAMNRFAGPVAPTSFGLLRVEHFDKGVPFDEGRWSGALAVPAITGAVMAFGRRHFEKVDGFSTRYIYGHYEDADLCLRWARSNGPVCVLPGLRLGHLEGQGSRPRGDQFRSAAIVNRHLFSLRHGDDYAARVDAFTEARWLDPA